MSSPTPEPALQAVRVWDLPTRLFHWLLALTVIGSVVTGQVGGNAMVWHLRLGLLALALLAFRVVWGFAGGYWSRFAAFAYGPSALLSWLRGDAGPGRRYAIGHSPLGALSVWALLGVLAAQVATGLVADDEISSSGPLNRFVSSGTANLASHWHSEIGKRLLIILVLMHVAAVLFYLVRAKRNRVGPMIHGDMQLPATTPASQDGAGQRLVAAAIFATASLLAWWIGSLATP